MATGSNSSSPALNDTSAYTRPAKRFLRTMGQGPRTCQDCGGSWTLDAGLAHMWTSASQGPRWSAAESRVICPPRASRCKQHSVRHDARSNTAWDIAGHIAWPIRAAPIRLECQARHHRTD